MGDNPHKERAQLAKAVKLADCYAATEQYIRTVTDVDTYERVFRSVDSHEVLADADDGLWRALAEVAGVDPPSDETKDLTIQVLLDRRETEERVRRGQR